MLMKSLLRLVHVIPREIKRKKKHNKGTKIFGAEMNQENDDANDDAE